MKKSTLLTMVATVALSVNALAVSSFTQSSQDSVGSVSGEVLGASDYLGKSMQQIFAESGSNYSGELVDGSVVLSGTVSAVSVGGSTVNSSNQSEDFQVSGLNGSITFVFEGSFAASTDVKEAFAPSVQQSNQSVFDGSAGKASAASVGSEVADASGEVSGTYSDSASSSAELLYDSAKSVSQVVVDLSEQGIKVSVNGVQSTYGWSKGDALDASKAVGYSAVSKDLDGKGNVSAQSQKASQAPWEVIQSVTASLVDSAESVADSATGSIDASSQISLAQDSTDVNNSVVTASLVQVSEGAYTSLRLVIWDTSVQGSSEAVDSEQGFNSTNSAESSRVVADIPLAVSVGGVASVNGVSAGSAEVAGGGTLGVKQSGK